MRHRTGVLLVLAGAVLTALVLPIVFGEPASIEGRAGGNPWRNWVYDFQTLITGLAAVGAATWTISVMERTDRRQSERHRELVELGQRSDRRRLQRAIEPQLEELEVVAASLMASVLDPAEFSDRPGDPVYHMVTAAAANYLTGVRLVQDILGRAQFVDGSELFDGRLTYSLRQLFENSEYLTRALETHLRADSWEDANFSHYYEIEFEEKETFLVSKLRSYLPQLQSVVDSLRETKIRHKL